MIIIAIGVYSVNYQTFDEASHTAYVPIVNGSYSPTVNITFTTNHNPFTFLGTLFFSIGWLFTTIGVVLTLKYLVKRGLIWQKQ